MRILIAETTWHSATAAADLRRAGFLLTRVESAAEVLDYAEGAAQSAIVLEADMPDMPAPTLVARLRGLLPATPIFALSRANGWAPQAPLWQAGADDVLCGRFRGPELAARLRAAIRRAGGYGADRIALDGLAIDTAAQEVTCQGTHLRLTRKEYEIVETLALARDRMVTRDELMARLYAWEDEPCPRILNVYLSRIRGQIAAAGGDPALVETVWGLGYRIAPAAMAQAA